MMATRTSPCRPAEPSLPVIDAILLTTDSIGHAGIAASITLISRTLPGHRALAGHSGQIQPFVYPFSQQGGHADAALIGDLTNGGLHGDGNANRQIGQPASQIIHVLKEVRVKQIIFTRIVNHAQHVVRFRLVGKNPIELTGRQRQAIAVVRDALSKTLFLALWYGCHHSNGQGSAAGRLPLTFRSGQRGPSAGTEG